MPAPGLQQLVGPQPTTRLGSRLQNQNRASGLGQGYGSRQPVGSGPDDHGVESLAPHPAMSLLRISQGCNGK